jgi:hypothetical protein
VAIVRITIFVFLISTLSLIPVKGYGRDRDVRTSITVYPNQFPASRICRSAASEAGNCPEALFTTFTMTYVVGTGTVFTAGTSIKTAFAYQYKGVYRTERRYTRKSAWPELQTRDATAPNYVTAKLENDRLGTIPLAVSQRPDGQVKVEFENTAAAGAKISITYGDTTGGSPGYTIPPVAYDIDLVVMRDSNGDGVYETIDFKMPTLSVIGTELDRFGVVAPSTPGSAAFDVIVTALQGEDERLLNSYVVPLYTGTIEFSSTDPDAVLPPPYTFRPGDKGVQRFNVALPTTGIHTITVIESGSLKSGTSNPVFTNREFDENHKMLYWGVLQQHTNIGGHGAQTPQYAYNYARNVSGLDFLTLTEHPTPEFDWLYNTELADLYYEPGEFVTFGAIEWSRNDFGHRHLIYRDSGLETGLSNCSINLHPTIPCVTSLTGLFDATRDKDILVIPHHMGWNFAGQNIAGNPVLGDIDNPNQRLYEIYSTHGSSEKYDNAPYPIHNDVTKQWGPDKKVYFQDALALGYRFGVTAGTDNHMGKPGGHISGSDGYSRQGITAVYADELTRDSIWEALWARRCYGTTGARIVVDFRINGFLMGSECVVEDPPVAEVSVSGTDIIDKISIIRNGYETVYETRPDSKTANFVFTDTDIEEGKEHSYYVRVVQKDLHQAWSSPVWVEFRPAKPFEIVSVFPNPFNPAMTVRFNLPGNTHVTTKVFTVTGAQIAVLADREFPTGSNEISWDGVDASGQRVASGVYFIRMNSDYGVLVRRAVLIR